MVGQGIIHQTYLVNASDRNLILQKINSSVFADPYLLVRNHQAIHRVLHDITVQPLPDVDNKGIVEEDGFWRAMAFCHHHINTESITAEEVYEAAKLFAQFTSRLSQQQLNLKPTIPNFHDPGGRYEIMLKCISTSHRTDEAQETILKLESFKSILELLRSVNQLPDRIVHNDTKIGNVLFDAHGNAIAVIDLDTTMAGKVIYDVGDLIRTAAVNKDENSTDTKNLVLLMDHLKAIVEGYRAGADSLISTEEAAHFTSGMLLITFEQATRFLTDYLCNDTYYKTDYPSQNLDRANNQLQLLELLMAHREEIKRLL